MHDRQKILNLREQISYVPNPVQVVKNKMNIYKIKNTIDKTFDEEEFLQGAQQVSIKSFTTHF
jgi:hypothetical protein